MKSLYTVITILAFALSVLAPTPPACLLSALNTQSNPANLTLICDAAASKVQSAIASLCTGQNVGIAQSAFVATCSAAGRAVVSSTTSLVSTSATSSGSSSTAVLSTSSSSASSNSAMSGTSSHVSRTSSTSGSGSGSASGSESAGSAGATSTAGVMPQGEKTRRMGGYAAAAVALVGVVGAL